MKTFESSNNTDNLWVELDYFEHDMTGILPVWFVKLISSSQGHQVLSGKGLCNYCYDLFNPHPSKCDNKTITVQGLQNPFYFVNPLQEQ